MNATRLLSSSFLVLAIALVLYGLFGLSHFDWYVGEYYDERMVLFDNGFYPFAWGVALLLIGQFARFHYRVRAMLTAGIVAVVVLLWKRATVPVPLADHTLFPDKTLLNELIVIAIVIVGLALAEPYRARDSQYSAPRSVSLQARALGGARRDRIYMRSLSAKVFRGPIITYLQETSTRACSPRSRLRLVITHSRYFPVTPREITISPPSP